MKTCIASRGLWAVAILKSLLCLSAGFSWLFNIWTSSSSRFFCDWQLAPAGLLCDLVTVNADWRRLNLLTDSRRTSPETQTQIWNWLRQLPPRTQVVHCLQTVHCWLPLMRQRWENSWILSSRLMMTPCARNASYKISRNRPIRTALTFRMRTSKALFVANSKLSTNAHLVRICPKDGSRRYVLIFKITSEI